MGEMQLVLGWPVDLEARRRLEAQAGQRLPAVYTGSIKAPCSRCGLEIWIGPRSQVTIAEKLAVPVCPSCAVASGAGPCISLGNPENVRPTGGESSN